MLLKGFRFQRCFIIISALSMSVSACNMETSIRKTNVDRTAPDAPVIVLKTPSKIIGINATPTFTISNLENGSTVELFSDECITKVGTAPANGTSINLMSSTISKGRYYFHARQKDVAGNVSNCSSTSADYQLSGTPMVSEWKTSTASETITLPLRVGFNYHILVDWGDGSNTSLIDSATDALGVHTYTHPGWTPGATAERVITIMGTAEAWSFGNVPASKNKILSVSELGDLGWISLNNSFSGCTNLTNVIGGNTSSVTDMSTMFLNALNAVPDTSGWDTSRVTDMNHAFFGAPKANPDTSKWDTSNVTNMAGMFIFAYVAVPNTSNWNTSNVTDMGSMFYSAHKANPDTSNWDTSNVTTMAFMFYGATLANPDVSEWNTSSVTNMTGLFDTAPHANPDVRKWDTTNVITMNAMFFDATIAAPDLSKWNFSSVTNMSLFTNLTFTNVNYSALLIQINATATHSNVTLGAGNSKYVGGAAVSARAHLVGAGNWIINDGGLGP